ncbi:hypothetical protein N658DRAFT_506650 [Parathielavia hyrcaniae]|uniref:Uncharacterized protein n=1 Tax=Parathielavia hyrcaniae TaxID=113614 RepID=A0AAN6Q1U1_9PEZI|nr:hypothetical protein N658DRAFT_506650 [Parathielavia hyrcaniae]
MDRSNPDEIDLSDEDSYNDPTDYDVAEDASMAATMGFTSFGGTKPTKEERKDDHEDNHPSRPSKKRRLDHQSDTADQQATTTSRTASQVLQPGSKPAATDEITYTDDEEDDFELDTTADLDDRDPAQPEPAAGETIAANNNTDNEGGRRTPSQPLPQSHPHSHILPQRPPATTSWTPTTTTTTNTNTNISNSNTSRGGRQAQGNRRHNPLWYINYYDPSSNENPWEGMEKHKGLSPVGSWVPRYWGKSTATAAAGAAAAAAISGAGAGSAVGEEYGKEVWGEGGDNDALDVGEEESG